MRINGDGSIRMIYQGTAANTTGTGTQITTSVFNSKQNNNMYAGYMYTQNQVHGLGTSSVIKEELDTWYINNLINYTNYIASNAGFCGDRTPYTNTAGTTSGGGTGIDTTYYGALIRLQTNKTPTFKCPEASDLYTKSGSTKGNKALTYPIGLITADEVSYAGGVYNINNTGYYLYTSQNYWTLSPYYSSEGYTRMWYIYTTMGGVYHDNVNTTHGVRPVINLKPSTVFTSGSKGTSAAPYIVAGAEY